MNSIQTPSLPREKKRFLLPFLLCSLLFSSVALGGTFLIGFNWNPLFHPFTNSPGSATVEAEWIVYPNGLDPANDFYLTSSTPHMVHGNEILFRYFNGAAQFLVYGMFDMYLNQPSAQPYIGTRLILGETRSVMRYRFSNIRTAGPSKVKLTCNNRAATITVGTSLPQSTIYVTGPNGIFPFSGAFQVVSSTGTQNISYTGTMGNANGITSFTGCTGGTGTLTQGSELNQLSGTQSAATHFRNTVYLWNYAANPQRWDLISDQEFDRTAFCHDCNVCGGCGFWGPTFESNYIPCATGVLPPIGVVDWLVSVDGGAFVQGNTSNSSFAPNLSGCGQSTPYGIMSYLPNYQWIIKTPDDK